MKNDAVQDHFNWADDIQPHDLLWIAGVDSLSEAYPLPEWAQYAIAAVPVVVVRRDLWCDGCMVPVGIRGRNRSERFATFVALRAVRRRVAPEDLVKAVRWRENRRSEFATTRRALEEIAERWDSIVWGPTGSVGFELATSTAVTTSESDLDLMIRAPRCITKREARILQQSVDELMVRTDVRMETPLGSVSLEEYSAPIATRILMKTCAGSLLVTDPWTGPMTVAV